MLLCSLVLSLYTLYATKSLLETKRCFRVRVVCWLCAQRFDTETCLIISKANFSQRQMTRARSNWKSAALLVLSFALSGHTQRANPSSFSVCAISVSPLYSPANPTNTHPLIIIIEKSGFAKVSPATVNFINKLLEEDTHLLFHQVLRETLACLASVARQ